MSKPASIPQSVVSAAIEQFDPDKAYGYHGSHPQTVFVETDKRLRFKFSVRPDEDTNVFDDGDCYGEFDTIHYNRNTGRAWPRPAGYDGRARKLHIGRGYDGYWWQPPADVADDQLDKLQATIERLMEYGYVGIIVQVDYLCECCRTWAELGYESLWGIDSIDDDYGTDVITDLLAELFAVAGVEVTS